MKTPIMKIVCALAVVLVSIPLSTEAYLTTDQSVKRVSPNTVLYTISYYFGLTDRELYMPIMAARNGEFGGSTTTVGYTLMRGTTPVTSAGTTTALVVATAPEIKNNQYYLSKGRAAEFTLMVLAHLPETANETLNDVSLQVTSLPFTMIEGTNRIEAKLNPSELQYYRTKTLKGASFVVVTNK